MSGITYRLSDDQIVLLFYKTGIILPVRPTPGESNVVDIPFILYLFLVSVKSLSILAGLILKSFSLTLALKFNFPLFF
jgi:hypothetical protein